MKPIPLVKVEARDNHEFGFKLGRQLRKKIKKRILKNRSLYKRLGYADFSQLKAKSQRFLPATQSYFPELVDEAEAMSLGAGVDFEELLVLLCEEELIRFDVPRCTTIAVKTAKGQILIGHNEDWLKEYLTNGLFLIKGKIKKIEFLALSYMGSMAGTSCGLTSGGLGFTGNSLTPGRFRYGIPKSFQMRAILTSKTLRTAIRADLKMSAISSNTLFVWGDERMVDVEDFFGHHRKFMASQYLIHANHPLLKEDQRKINTSLESVKRYNRAKAVIMEEKKITANILKKILTDHKVGICGHRSRKKSQYGVTLASVIINPSEGWMKLARGNPCKNRYVRYSL